MRKRILSALLAVMFLITGLPGTAWAVGEGNMEAGGGGKPNGSRKRRCFG